MSHMFIEWDGDTLAALDGQDAQCQAWQKCRLLSVCSSIRTATAEGDKSDLPCPLGYESICQCHLFAQRNIRTWSCKESVDILDIQFRLVMTPLLHRSQVERPTHVLSTLHGSASYSFGKQQPQQLGRDKIVHEHFLDACLLALW